MALTKKKRDSLPDSDFADPEHRKYPINDKEHAIVAAGLAGMHGVSGKTKAAIKRKASKKGVRVK
jgi:hypothetical protein